MDNVNIEYFRTVLDRYTGEKYPELPDREQRIRKGSARAVRTYRELTGKGMDHRTALEAACLELTGGFGFSMFQYLYDLVFDSFPEITDETRRDFCIAILAECKKAVENLNYDNMDEWEARFRFEEKLSETVQNAIDDGYFS